MGDPELGHWFEPLADHMGPAYLRYSFTKGTTNEVDAIVELTGVAPGARILDLGCGPGRHSLELARRGHEVVGVDVSAAFIDLARSQAAEEGLEGTATFICRDARTIDFDAEFDLVISLCQGAFGLTGGPGCQPPPGLELDETIMVALARALRPGGRLVLSAFSAYFQVRHLGEDEDFDAVDGVSHEHTMVSDPAGLQRQAELWTTCYTPRELRLLARLVGFRPDEIHGVTPGRYRSSPPGIDQPEFLLVATRL